MADIDVVLVTGLSGAGRGTAAKVLEDLGWYVADNLPPQLITRMVDFGLAAGSRITQLAVVMDVRSRGFTGDLDSVRKELATRDIHARVLFMEATDDILVRRYENNRRSHPLQGNQTLAEGIAAERTMLAAAWDAALEADPVSAFGGVVALTRPVDAAVAEKLVSIFLEIVVAPAFDAEALEILATKPNLRVVWLRPDPRARIDRAYWGRGSGESGDRSQSGNSPVTNDLGGRADRALAGGLGPVGLSHAISPPQASEVRHRRARAARRRCVSQALDHPDHRGTDAGFTDRGQHLGLHPLNR